MLVLLVWSTASEEPLHVQKRVRQVVRLQRFIGLRVDDVRHHVRQRTRLTPHFHEFHIARPVRAELHAARRLGLHRLSMIASLLRRELLRVYHA
jgi:hypothetical protein